jgi:arsenite-transporting ATPase
VPRFRFFLGKGGVGKTTVSSAYALHRAVTHPREAILLLSTDPAHSLSDILETKLGDHLKRLPTPGRLWARQLDANKQIQSFLAAERDQLLGVLNRGSFFTRDELEPLLDTTLPGMAEVAALLAIHELLDSPFGEVVVDTAPMGHAIRLFQMPAHFARFLRVLETAAERDVVLAQHFGGRVQREPLLDRWSRMVQRVTQALSRDSAKLVLVTTPEPFSLNEVVRSAAAFEESGPANRISEIVMNRVVDGVTRCLHCKHRAAQSRSARRLLRRHFGDARLFAGGDPGGPILGITALRKFGRHVMEATALPSSIVKKPAKSALIKLKPAEWPRLRAPLTLTVGKGGVGKTTVSAGLAVNHRRQAPNESVSICSIDPAPSLDDVFAAKVGSRLQTILGDRKLRAAELDAMTEFKHWAEEMRARLSQAMTSEQRGVHLDLSLDREFLLALLDVVPPGVDEIFAVFGILDLMATDERVVIDMAPTGHALEVLRTPARLLAWARLLLKTLAAHRTLPFARDAAVEIAKLSQSAKQVAAILRDRKRCQVALVTLPEPLPDYETRRLLTLLRELDAPIGEIFVNRVVSAGKSRCPRCRRTSDWQRASLATLRRMLRGLDVYMIREFDTPIAGVKALQRFSRELWQLS